MILEVSQTKYGTETFLYNKELIMGRNRDFFCRYPEYLVVVAAMSLVNQPMTIGEIVKSAKVRRDRVVLAISALSGMEMVQAKILPGDAVGYRLTTSARRSWKTLLQEVINNA